jgi:adenylate cyclase class 2
MKEVEVKARLHDGAKARETLTALGCAFSEPIVQDDTTYVREPGSVETYLANAEFLRLRVQDDGTVLFTLKYHPGRAGDLWGAPMEYETAVGSKDEMEHMLLLMGFKKAVCTKKKRLKTRHGNWEICIDEVEGLGAFIELEELADEQVDIAPIHVAMRAFLKSIGIAVEDTGLKRYDILMLEKEAGR